MKTPFALVGLCLTFNIPSHAQESPPYAIEFSISPKAVDQAGAELKLTIAPKNGWVLKKQTPFKVTLSPSDGIRLGQSTFDSKDFTDPEAKSKTIGTKIQRESPGPKKISANLSFFLCSAEICQRFTDKAELSFSAKK